uniref:Fibronectin type-III domain-containing protein n=1 Tax=Ciona savignyi TaxID=51511 RepID=H2YER0_CIOSA
DVCPTSYVAVYTGPSDVFSFLGKYGELDAYTTYEYKVMAENKIGVGESSSSDITMPQSRPSGVMPPDWSSDGRDAITLLWQPPTQPNGTILLDFQSKPEGVWVPTATLPLDLIHVDLLWTEPLRPNGAIQEYSPWQLVFVGQSDVFNYTDTISYPRAKIQYQLGAMNGAGFGLSEIHDVQMPIVVPPARPVVSATVLSPTVIRVEWELSLPTSEYNYSVVVQQSDSGNRELLRLIPTGSDMTQVIEDLTPHTTYRIRVMACMPLSGDSEGTNSTENCNVGQSTLSETFSAPPAGQDKPTLKATGGRAVDIKWKEPTHPNGVIQGYFLHRKLANPSNIVPIEKRIYSGNPTTFNYIDTDPELIPFTEYKYKVTSTTNEGNAVSDWASVSTKQDAPTGVSPPILQAVSAFAVNASWDAPLYPNGVIASYRIEHREIGDDPTIPPPIVTSLTVPSDLKAATFSGLRPFTAYHVRILAVNQAGMEGRSEWRRVKTLSAAPSEVAELSVEKNPSGRSVILTWEEPALPNGEIHEYNIYEPKESEEPIYSGRVRQYEFRRLTPYTQYSLDDLFSIPRIRRSILEDSQFNTLLPNSATIQTFDISSNFADSYDYISVNRVRRQITDSNVDGDHEVYNYTDSGLRPFTRYQYKIRTSTAAGHVDSNWVTVETHQAPPEGISAPVVTHPHDRSSASLEISWYPPQHVNGEMQIYKLQRGNSTPFIFPPDQLRYTDVGLQPYTDYEYSITACTAGGCTTSDTTVTRTYEEAPQFVAPPNVVAFNSTSLQTSWESPGTQNGIIVSYKVFVDNELRYQGNETETMLTRFLPFRVYSVALEACTNSGCRRSIPVQVRTLEGIPSGMSAPDLHVTGAHSIEVTWHAPSEPNGNIIRYEVRRNGELVSISDGLINRYDDYELIPGTEYTYVVIAYNSRGSVSSEPPVSETTYQSAPAGLDAPTLTPTSGRYMLVEWTSPVNPNGVILNYTLYSYEFSAETFSFELGGLEPYEEYYFWLQTCTLLGCVMSERNMKRTLEDSPTNLNPPSVVIPQQNQVSMVLEVSWTPPLNTNGVIRYYWLFRRRIIDNDLASGMLERRLIANTTETTYTDDNVVPYSMYEYQVNARNGAGETTSSWSPPVLSGEAPPNGVPAPTFQDVTARSVRVTAQDPERENGEIRTVAIYMKQNDSDDQMARVTSGSRQAYPLVGLQPATTYRVAVEMCTLGSMCTRGPSGFVTTLSAPPSGQSAPTVDKVTAVNMSLSWREPTHPNGRISRRGCRDTYPPVECHVSPTVVGYSGLSTSTVLRNLVPYTRYDFKVNSYNEFGSTGSSWGTAIT